MKAKKHSRAFSMMEVVIVLGLLSFAGITLSKLIQTSLKSQKNVQNHVDFDLIRTSLQNILRNNELCSVAFKNSLDENVTINPTSTLI